MVECANVKLYLDGRASTDIVKCKQHDTIRRIKATIINEGEELQLGIFNKAEVLWTKPDGKEVHNNCNINGNNVLIDLTDQMLAVDGKAKFEVVLRDKNGNITTGMCPASITKRVHEDLMIESLEEYKTFENAVYELEKFTEQITNLEENKAPISAIGSPLTSRFITDFVDTERIYVYTGSEAGYETGHWYYNNGTTWVDGGVYNSQGIGKGNVTKEMIAQESIDYSKLTKDFSNCIQGVSLGEVKIQDNSYDNSYTGLNVGYAWVLKKEIPSESKLTLEIYAPSAGNLHIGTYNTVNGKIENKRMVAVQQGQQEIDLRDFVITDTSYFVVRSLSNSLAYKVSDSGVIMQRFDGSSFNNGSSPTLEAVSSKFLWSMKLKTISDKFTVNLVLPNTGNMYTVGQNGNCDFKTIAEAILGTDEDDTIYIMPGIYHEKIKMYEKKRHLVGVSKESCIIVSDDRFYNNEPIQANLGTIENLTFIAGYGLTPIDGDTSSTSYAIHIEHEHDTPYELTIRNCRIISNVAPAIGMGVRYNQTVRVIDCELESYAAQMWSSNEGRFFDSGAIFVHNDASGSNLGNDGVLELRHSTIKGIDTAMTIRSLNNNNELTVIAIGNLLHSEHNGKNNAIYKWGNIEGNTNLCGNDVILDELSFGNNIQELNS